MKKAFLFIVFALLLSSCSMYKSYNETVIIDYSSYFEDGFFLTESNSVSFDYKPIGSVISYTSGGEQTYTTKKEKSPDAKYSVKDNRSETNYKTVSYSMYDALDQMVLKCKSKGANGIINLKITAIYNKDSGQSYSITGMAIKK